MENREKQIIRSESAGMWPPIPNGWKQVQNESKNVFVIERVSDKSQFVWIPVCAITPNGSVDGIHLKKQFGRRSFDDTEIISYKETMDSLQTQSIRQRDSVAEYGGFYISKYLISTSQYKLLSVANQKPLVNVSWYEALCSAQEFCDFWDFKVTSHLVYPSEYDSMIQWLIELGVIDGESKQLVVSPKDCIIPDIGSLGEWTQEQCIEDEELAIARGTNSITSREPFRRMYRNGRLGFRIALCIIF